MDKLSYAWGLAMGQQLRGMGVKDLNVEDYAAAVKAVFEGTESAIPFEEAQTLINEYLQNLEEEMTKAMELKVPLVAECKSGDSWYQVK